MRKSDDEQSNLSDDLDDEIPSFSDYNWDEDETFNPAMEKLDEDAAMEIHVEEREDVTEYKKKFVRKFITLGFINVIT